MKRATQLLDSTLLFVWGFLAVFFGAALIYRFLPLAWQPDIEMATVLSICFIVLCSTSSIRFLAYMEYPQWAVVPIFLVTILIYWLRPGPLIPWSTIIATGAPATLILTVAFVLFHRFVPLKIKMRFPWQKKLSKEAKMAQRALALKSLVETGK